MRVYTKYRTAQTRRSAASHFQWFLASLLAAFLIWVWWKNLQGPTRFGFSDAIERVTPTPVVRTARSGLTNLITPITPTRPIGPGAKDPATPASRIPRNAYEIQIALARRGYSSGSLDGVMGSQTRACIRAFQEKEHLAITGEADAVTKSRLGLTTASETVYTVTAEDLGRLSPVGPTWLTKSLQDRLDYETILELLSEKGHAHPNLIRQLNPSVDWNKVTAGTTIRLPDIDYPAPQGKAAFIKIRLNDRVLEAYGARSNLLAHFPCSIARQVDKRPTGKLLVESVVLNPDYKFSPEIFPESDEARLLKHALMIPKGPNNPVGTAWIGLNRPGYGIHGTPRPEDVGRTESHGCFRLANWNAEYLAQLVAVGTPVIVVP